MQATAVVGVFGLTVASTGASEKGLRRAGVTGFEVVYLHPGHHAGYYPGAQPIHLKLLFSVPEGRVLGVQAVGHEGVEKRVDVIAAMIQMGGTVHDLAEAELCYAPQFGAAKDPVNLAGMIAANHLRATCRSPTGAGSGRTGRWRWTSANPTSSPPGTLPVRSTCRSRSSAGGMGSCRVTARSPSTARWDSADTTRSASSCSTATGLRTYRADGRPTRRSARPDSFPMADEAVCEEQRPASVQLGSIWRSSREGAEDA